jgi:hypothetical protein
MTIKVKLNGNTVTVHPDIHAVNKGSRPLEWGPHENSDTFTFDDPPITFYDPNAPISGITATGDSASGTDNNTSTTDTDYGYQVHLIDAAGNHITFPATDGTTRGERATQKRNTMQAESMMAENDPVIRNRPS